MFGFFESLHGATHYIALWMLEITVPGVQSHRREMGGGKEARLWGTLEDGLSMPGRSGWPWGHECLPWGLLKLAAPLPARRTLAGKDM